MGRSVAVRILTKDAARVAREQEALGLPSILDTMTEIIEAYFKAKRTTTHELSIDMREVSRRCGDCWWYYPKDDSSGYCHYNPPHEKSAPYPAGRPVVCPTGRCARWYFAPVSMEGEE